MRVKDVVLLFIVLLTSATLWAKDASPAVTTDFSVPACRKGEYGTLTVHIAIPDTFHLYSMTKIKNGPKPLKIIVGNQLKPSGKWFAAVPQKGFDKNFNKEVFFYEKEVTYRRVFSCTQGGTVPIKVSGQICDEHNCLLFKKEAPVNITLAQGSPRAPHSVPPALQGAPVTETLTNATGSLGQNGIIGLIILAFLAGLGALLTPCVFPMIPITVSFFSKFQKESMKRAFLMASMYAGSIIVTFTLIGVAVSAIFGAVGMQALSSSPFFNLFLTILLIVFAFNLFGFFEIQVPTSVIASTSKKEMELNKDDSPLFKQLLGVFLMAVTFTLISFTCTVGFIGIVIAEAARGNWFFPAIGMLSFSVAFSIPFFFLALFPSWADKLKGKGGDWMVAVKVSLGFLEIVGAFKFLSNVDLIWRWGLITRPFVLTLWTALFGTTGYYLLRGFELPHSDSNVKKVGPIRMIFAVFFFAFAIYSSTAIRSTESMGGWLDGWLPPAIYPGTASEIDTETSGKSSHLSWIVDDIPKGVQEGKAKKKPLFIDFTGYTCTNCRYMESSVFPDRRVKPLLEKMVRVSAYTDADNEVNERQRQWQIDRFETAALPFYAIIDADSDEVLATFPSMTNNIDEFATFLQNGLQAYRERHSKQTAQTNVPAGQSKPVYQTFPSLLPQTQPPEFEHHWTLLNLWASWCAPCKEELKTIFPNIMKQAPDTLQFVTVAFDGDETEAAQAFVKQLHIRNSFFLKGPESVDEAEFPKEFGIDGSLPMTYLLSPEGKIVWMKKGEVTQKELQTALSKLPTDSHK